MQINLKVATMAAALAATTALAPIVASAQPMVDYRQEAAAHPRMVQAIRQAEGSLRLLQAAPDDFGGRKARAISDLRQAIHSMRAALFFRMRMDDRAIDAAQF